jgi:azobenzene reductase
MEPIKVISIVGSPRPNSRTAAGDAAVRQALMARGAACRVWNLGRQPLPLLDPDADEDVDGPAARLVAAVRQADAVVLASPIYHNSFSGHLKVALDHLGMDDVGGRAVGLVSHGGARSTQAVDQLRIVVRSLHGVAVNTQLCTDEADFGDGPRLIDPAAVDRAGRLADELLAFATMLRDHWAAFATTAL